MLTPVKYVSEKTNKNLRSEYNEIYENDVKRDYFTEEDRQVLEDVKKRNLVHGIYEYNVAKKYMQKKVKYQQGHLISQVVPTEQEQYKINYYITSYSCDWIEPILEGVALLSKNELEAFYYYHSKKYGETIFIDSENQSNTKTFLCMKNEEEYEFCVIGKMNLIKIQSLNAMIKSDPWKEKYKKLSISKSK